MKKKDHYIGEFEIVSIRYMDADIMEIQGYFTGYENTNIINRQKSTLISSIITLPEDKRLIQENKSSSIELTLKR